MHKIVPERIHEHEGKPIALATVALLASTTQNPVVWEKDGTTTVKYED